ncbi:MAG: hypothetical protein HY518_01230, partial [Candidatus Aenigmarchaeota archaeon]|nr:hypothetical protein [Candidatus Aenigmarchaeota archaeon]
MMPVRRLEAEEVVPLRPGTHLAYIGPQTRALKTGTIYTVKDSCKYSRDGEWKHVVRFNEMYGYFDYSFFGIPLYPIG